MHINWQQFIFTLFEFKKVSLFCNVSDFLTFMLPFYDTNFYDSTVWKRDQDIKLNLLI